MNFDANRMLLSLVDAIAKSTGRPLGKVKPGVKSVQKLIRTFQAEPSFGLRPFGTRAESMFAYLAGALGKTSLVTKEDTGEFYPRTGLRQPDFHLVLKNGVQLLVEVKNCHWTGGFPKPVPFKTSYLDDLKRYADLMRSEVKIAVYWSPMKLWTMVSIDNIPREGSRALLSLDGAMVQNEMFLLGDVNLALIPPISLRLGVEAKLAQKGRTSNSYEMKVAQASISCGGKIATNPEMQRFLWFAMEYGNWQKFSQPVEMDRDLPVAVEFQVAPIEMSDSKQPFEILGALSSMYSRRFVQATTSSKGELLALTPPFPIESLAVPVPQPNSDSNIPMWHFVIHPKGEAQGLNPTTE